MPTTSTSMDAGSKPKDHTRPSIPRPAWPRLLTPGAAAAHATCGPCPEQRWAHTAPSPGDDRSINMKWFDTTPVGQTNGMGLNLTRPWQATPSALASHNVQMGGFKNRIHAEIQRRLRAPAAQVGLVAVVVALAVVAPSATTIWTPQHVVSLFACKIVPLKAATRVSCMDV